MFDELNRLIDRYEDDMVSITRLACATLSTKVVTRTPVLFGSARASWNASIGAPVTNDIVISAETPTPERNDYAAVANSIDVGDTFSLVNGTPYIFRLEYEGWSAKAPQGMLRRSIAEWQNALDESVRRVT